MTIFQNVGKLASGSQLAIEFFCDHVGISTRMLLAKGALMGPGGRVSLRTHEEIDRAVDALELCIRNMLETKDNGS